MHGSKHFANAPCSCQARPHRKRAHSLLLLLADLRAPVALAPAVPLLGLVASAACIAAVKHVLGCVRVGTCGREAGGQAGRWVDAQQAAQ